MSDSLGVLAWETLATRAHVGDSAAFRECARERRFTFRVDQDREEGRRLGVYGTPTFVFAGKLMSGLPGLREVEMLIGRELAAR